MKKILTTLCLSASIASASMLLGFGVEADYYAPEATGTFNYSDKGFATSTVFDGESADSYALSAYFEHPIPIIPNFKIDYIPESKFSGSNGSSGTNEVTFSQLDVTAYYEILDSIVDLDIGVTGKIIDGSVKSTGLVEQDGQFVVPMGYVGASVSIPALPIRVDADVKYISYDKNSVSDMKIKVAWEVIMGLEIAAGYRYENLQLDDSDVYSDLKIQGPFVGVGYRF